MSLEKSWNTNRQAIRCFYFVIVACEINAFLDYFCFTNSKIELLQFRKQLIKMLVSNLFHMGVVDARQNGVQLRRTSCCELVNHPPFQKTRRRKLEKLLQKPFKQLT